MDTDALITAVFNKPVIWDTRIKDSSNRGAVDKAWKEISDEIKIEESQVRKKWKSLRELFGDEYNRIQKQQRSGDDDAEDNSRWRYYKQMLFLKEIMTPRTSSGSLNSSSGTSTSNKRSTGSKSKKKSNQKSAAQDQKHAKFDSTLSSETNKNAVTSKHTTFESRKSAQFGSDEPLAPHYPSLAANFGDSDKDGDDLDDEEEDSEGADLNEELIPDAGGLEKERGDNDDLLFFKSLLPYTKKMSPNVKLLLRTRILNVLSELALGDTTCCEPRPQPDMTYAEPTLNAHNPCYQSQRPNNPPLSPGSYRARPSPTNSCFKRMHFPETLDPCREQLPLPRFDPNCTQSLFDNLCSRGLI